MLRSVRRAAVLGAIAGVAGCASVIGLTDFEIVPSDGGAPDAARGDVTPPLTDGGPLPAVTCNAPSGTCAALGLDAGFQPIGVIAGDVTCPSGFGAAIIVQGIASTTGACDCTVDTTTPPTCDTTEFEFEDGNDVCNAPTGSQHPVTNGSASTCVT